jgi:RIO kinase 1
LKSHEKSRKFRGREELEEESAEESSPLAPLTSFFQNEWIVGEPTVIKSGKEATVYRCQAHPNTGMAWVAAKVYRPRQSRSFKNDAVYQQGRTTLDKRLDRAIRNKSRKGREVQFHSWLGHEYATLSRLHAAGADVPRPYTCSGSALLMEYIGDSDGSAPHLHSVTLERHEAHALFEQVLRNIHLWLQQDRIHGDLSGYNILYWQRRLTVIDFPQSVDPQANSNALMLLERDLTNVYDVFEGYGVQADPARIAQSLWTRYLRDTL